MKKITSFLSIFSFLFLLLASVVNAQLNFYFVNVGMGNATYIELPNGHNALIDGGPSVKPIEAFLKSKNITHIDHVVLTHPHSDHYMGLKKVFKIATVSNFYDSKAENLNAKGDNNLRALADAQGSVTHYPKIGEQLNWDNSVNIKVLHTCEDVVATRNNGELNNCSIVLKFTYAGQKVLLVGDLEEPGEKKVLSRFSAEELKADVLEPGHHGSKTASSQAFLNAVRPKIAILSYGTNNKYGFPHFEVVSKLQAMNVLMYATNEQTQTMFLKPLTRSSNADANALQVNPYNSSLPVFNDNSYGSAGAD
ncbi:MAG: MBL fold metallo-hydrolase, partial [Elusimicrobiales bacterium]|nr:MBL fold metallo-hydrolase [Elusimicrobiales bacterium]